MADTRLAGTQVFPNFQHLPPLLSPRLASVLRWTVLVVYLALVLLLLLAPVQGLLVFWGLVVPALPALLVVAPGLWRAICPMAFANQAPSLLGFGLRRSLPAWLAACAFAIAVSLFVSAVALRPLILNDHGTAVATLLLVAPALALVGGFLFKGRSGWCGTFCPLGPLQRDYGHAPTIVVPNTQCGTCVGCQSGCYDFAPQATLFDDVLGDDPRQAGQRRFFMSMMPGLIAGYFLQIGANHGYPLWLAIFLGSILATVGLYQFAISFLGTDPARTAAVFAAAAVALFNGLAAGVVVHAVEALTGLVLPDVFEGVLAALGIIIGGTLLFQSFRLAQRYDAAAAALQPVSAAVTGLSVSIEDRGTGRIFSADIGQTLLAAMQAAGLPVVGVCRAGACGSDPVVILEGGDHLSSIGADEAATLARLAVPTAARLACQAVVSGPLVIDTDVSRHKSHAEKKRERPAEGREDLPVGVLVTRTSLDAAAGRTPLDQADLAGVGHVVIIGNGVAGSTAAEELRRISPAVRITLLSIERHAFYNRMALAPVAAGKESLERISMIDAGWAQRVGVSVRLGTRVSSIDRAGRTVTTLTGETLAYDRLVLATGARASLPMPGFLGRSNSFVLRTAHDALAISDCIRRTHARRALVLGGGVLGVETAEALARAGLSVGIIHRGRHLMERQLDSIGARLLEQYLAGLDIDIVTGASIERLIGDDRLMAVKLERPPAMNADLFVAAIGNTANTELAASCGLATERGILVNGRMRTDDPAIFAIGDCAEQGGVVSGLWSSAVTHARIAAAAIMDMDPPAVTETSKPVLQLKSAGIDLLSVGTVFPKDPEIEILRAPAFSTKWWSIALRDGAIVGANVIGPVGSLATIRRQFASGRLDPELLESLRAGRLERAAAHANTAGPSQP
ncbi:2Fe-2S iron-sulfur cluster binding domain-containing protein [Rhizobium sp. RU20A]|uniref:FAD-dependent oxidoreductase n=1 Tax=Rhizobium sp. RU20A TaxID=1907412 RepID=UPI0009540825|nr:FAD-dependent oxidoreductase [Rhizobium sp. RU20A]SIQ86927.1 2Fe-2S iron-sulfur cluster binding domain-containing protein [Rhizobium sp. RU20A]